MDKFLNFYTKYPWVAIVIVVQWLATAFMIIYASDVDITRIMGMTFFSTVVFAYFGYKLPKD
ncbi:MAG TPA: hypothetical protein VK338_06795 [Candidatus Nitrosocosmicus sp.]|nr:hypothetical protein [Candidatus Nitrosocosmicus sp.]